MPFGGCGLGLGNDENSIFGGRARRTDGPTDMMTQTVPPKITKLPFLDYCRSRGNFGLDSGRTSGLVLGEPWGWCWGNFGVGAMAAPAKVDIMRRLDGVLWVSTTQWKPFRDVSFVINFVYSTTWDFAENRMLVAVGEFCWSAFAGLGLETVSRACMRQLGGTFACVRPSIQSVAECDCDTVVPAGNLVTRATGRLVTARSKSSSQLKPFATEVYPPHGTLGVAQRMGVAARTLACLLLLGFVLWPGLREATFSGLRASTKV